MGQYRLLVAALVSATLAGCASPDPLPGLHPQELYGTELTFSGRPVPGRAVLMRQPDGVVVLALRGYEVEPEGVRHWEPVIDVFIPLTEVDNRLVLSSALEPAVALESPMREGGPGASLALTWPADGPFVGDLDVEVRSADGLVSPLQIHFEGAVEAVECDHESGAEPLRLGSRTFDCTADTLHSTFAAPPGA